MKKILSLLLMLFMGMTMWAGTIVFADLGLENGVQYLGPFDGGDLLLHSQVVQMMVSIILQVQVFEFMVMER